MRAVILAGVVVPGFVLVAPLQSKWLCSAGLETAYGWLDQPPAHFGPPPGAVLTAAHIQEELRDDYVVRLTQREPPGPHDPFGHEDPQHPLAANFREQTADLVPELFDVLEVARRTRAIARHETDWHGNDVHACLQAARDGRGLWCHHFSRIFGSACAVRGYSTRIVSLSALGVHFDHAMCEIYLPQHGKWVVIDNDFEVIYKRNGEWLNAVEIQETWRTVCNKLCPGGTLQQRREAVRAKKSEMLQLANIDVVAFGQSEPQLRAERLDMSPSGINIELFEYVFLARRDDYITANYSPGHPRRIRQLGFRADGRTDLVQICPSAAYLPAKSAYGPINVSWIDALNAQPNGQINLRLATKTPWFDRFEVRRGDGPWNPVSTADNWVSVQLQPGQNKLAVRAVNSWGVPGEAARLEVVAPQSHHLCE